VTWSDDALQLRKPHLVELPRSSDRVSFIYLDRVKIWQDETGVVARNDRAEQLRIPVGSVSVLLLGPGCSITTPATVTIHRAGCTIVTTSDGGVAAITAGRPLAGRAKWSEAQARLWADRDARLVAARTLYTARFPDIDWAGHRQLRTMRGLEGHQVKLLYQRHAAQAGVSNWRRDTRADDLPNQLLNLANSILYGSAAAAVHALALNPALGIIHQGAAGALLFDLADNHKAVSSIPLAFACAKEADPQRTLRRKMRHYLHRKTVLDHHLKTLDEILAPHVRPASNDDALLDDEHDSVAGHTNHADEYQGGN
jgi:CRISP-associated protein Cas1